MRDWAKEFADFRTTNNMTQEQFAEVLDLCPKTIWNIEKGKTVPQMRVKFRFNALVKKYQEAAKWQVPQSKSLSR